MDGFTKFLTYATLLMGFALGVAYLTMVEVWTVPKDDPLLATSVLPALLPGDRLLISRASDPGVPALVRCADPQSPSRFVVGRIVAQDGEAVNIEGDVVTVGNRRKPSPHRCATPSFEVSAPGTGEIKRLDCREEEFGGRAFDVLNGAEASSAPYSATVEPDRAFLVSDDRRYHLDSRDYGSVDRHSCHRVLFRLWSEAGYFDDVDHRFNVIW